MILGRLFKVLLDKELGGADGAGAGVGAGAGTGTAAPVVIEKDEQDFYKIPSKDDEGEPERKKGGKDKDEPENLTDDDDEEKGEDLGAEGGEDDGEDKGEDGGEDDGEEGKGDAKPQLLRLDPESLEALRGPREQKQEEEPQLSPEQIKKIFNPVQVTDDVVAGIRSEDPKVAADTLQKFANATVLNAVSIAKALIAKKEKEFESRLQPLAQQHEQSAAAQRKEAFFKANPDLTKYPKMVKLAALEVSHLHPDGREKTGQEIFAEVAKNVRKELKEMGVALTPNNSREANHGAGSGKGNGGVPPPNRMSGSGRSGSDSTRQAPKPNAGDADIYRRR